ncbi:hypothetical protein Tco_0503191, partial [Tanacetum coccineum]
WAVRVGEGQSLILKTSAKESAKKGGKLSVLGSPVLREPTGAVAKASLHRAIVTAYGPEPGDSQEVCLEAATLERVRNSSLIERSCAEDEPAKRSAEAEDVKIHVGELHRLRVKHPRERIGRAEAEIVA